MYMYFFIVILHLILFKRIECRTLSDTTIS